MTDKKRAPWAMYKDYLISFKLKDGQFRVYDARTHTVSTMEILPLSINKFKMLTNNDNTATDEDLFKYSKDFMQWNKELRFHKQYSFRYSECYSDYTSVTRFFNARCDYKTHMPISPTEYKYYEMCANFGIQYLEKNDYTKSGYGYDFKNQYALVLNSTSLIPTKEGKEYTLKKLPKKRKELKHGFYRVIVTCTNDNFRKIFAFSKHHCYLHESLKIAMKYKKEFDVKLELIQDNKPNAYLYEEDDLVTLNSICSRWFTELTEMRKEFPKNRLIKHLLSSAWGHLNADNKTHVSVTEMQTLDVGCDMDHKYMVLSYNEFEPHTKKEPYWEVLDTKRPYKHNIRLKPWITALARNMTANIVLQDIKNVVRVQTDSVVFKKEMKFDDPNLIPEEKTTGKIHWMHCNCYHNITTGYKSKNYKEA